jgi:hypothetical protein
MNAHFLSCAVHCVGIGPMLDYSAALHCDGMVGYAGVALP